MNRFFILRRLLRPILAVACLIFVSLAAGLAGAQSRVDGCVPREIDQAVLLFDLPASPTLLVSFQDCASETVQVEVSTEGNARCLHQMQLLDVQAWNRARALNLWLQSLSASGARLCDRSAPTFVRDLPTEPATNAVAANDSIATNEAEPASVSAEPAPVEARIVAAQKTSRDFFLLGASGGVFFRSTSDGPAFQGTISLLSPAERSLFTRIRGSFDFAHASLSASPTSPTTGSVDTLMWGANLGLESSFEAELGNQLKLEAGVFYGMALHDVWVKGNGSGTSRGQEEHRFLFSIPIEAMVRTIFAQSFGFELRGGIAIAPGSFEIRSDREVLGSCGPVMMRVSLGAFLVL